MRTKDFVTQNFSEHSLFPKLSFVIICYNYIAVILLYIDKRKTRNKNQKYRVGKSTKFIVLRHFVMHSIAQDIYTPPFTPTFIIS